MSEMPVENRWKYGRDCFDDDDLVDDFAAALTGSKRSRPVAQSSRTNEVDEDVFSAARDSARKYGA